MSDTSMCISAVATGDFATLKKHLTMEAFNKVVKMTCGRWSLLHHAAFYTADTSIIALILDLGVHADLDERFISTALSYTVKKDEKLSASRLLLQRTANPNAVDENTDKSILDIAILTGSVATAVLLIDYGARVKTQKLGPLRKLVKSRECCRQKAIQLVAIRRHRLSGEQDVNVFILIGKHMWSMRMEEPLVAKSKRVRQ